MASGKTSKCAITKVHAIIAMIIILAVAISAAYYYLTLLSAPKEEILIGAAVSQTGAYGPEGEEVVLAYKLWEKDVNDRGGLFGHPVRLILYDDKSDPTTTKACYERILTVDKVVFVLGPIKSSCAFAMAPVTEQYRKVTMQTMCSSSKVYQGMNYQVQVHTLGIADLNKMDSVFQVLSALPDKPKTIGIINAADVFPRATAQGSLNSAEKYGFQVVISDEIDTAAVDVSSSVIKLKSANPDVVIISSALPQEILLINTMADLGFKPKALYAMDVIESYEEAAEVAGPRINYVFGHIGYLEEVETPIRKDFYAKFVKEYDHNPDENAAMGYSACLLLEAAIKGVGERALELEDQSPLVEWLKNNKVETPLGPWEIDNDIAAQGYRYVAKSTAAIVQIIDLKPVIIWPPEMAQANLVYPIP